MILTEQIATNIAAHAQLAWIYDVPNATAAEKIIATGLKPFFPNTVRLGGSATIVDVKSDHRAFDIKSKGDIKFYNKKPRPHMLKSDGQYFEIIKDSIWVRRPNSVLLPSRRTPIDMQGWNGNSNTIMTLAIQEYRDYANKTVQEANCTELTSVLLIYGEGLGYKSIYLEEQEFAAPDATSFGTSTIRKTKKDPVPINNGYKALDVNGKLLYASCPYGSDGSINFLKRFDLSNGYLFVWPSTAIPTNVTSISDWSKQGNYKVCI
jgi:hypothetical protein